jgi:hypothetical protein
MKRPPIKEWERIYRNVKEYVDYKETEAYKNAVIVLDLINYIKRLEEYIEEKNA